MIKKLRNIPGILVSNVSFPKILEEKVGARKENPKIMFSYLLKSINQLEKSGANFLVLPCNTLHVLLPGLKKESKLEILDLIEEVSKRIKKEGLMKVGILSTTATRNDKLYDKNLKSIKLIYPTEDDQKRISEIIIRIIRKEDLIEDKKFLNDLINKLISKGAEKVILACTDLANLIGKHKKTLDSTEILIESIKKKMIS